MKLVTVIGARPQFIKAAVVSRAVRELADVQERIVHTGQHYDNNMNQLFFHQLGIPEPHYNLSISGGSHGEQTGRMLQAVESALLVEAPDLVLVYGDTNSTLAGALAAAKIHIPVAHVEAGLRSFNRRMPEELNRIATDHLSDLLLAPTVTAVSNLTREGVESQRVRLVGDVMYDAAIFYAERAEQNIDLLRDLSLTPKSYVLATIHRAENTDDSTRLKSLFSAFISIARDLPVIIPLHPRTRACLANEGLLQNVMRHLRVLEPMGYLEMALLERNARLIATDSGGVQKEAFFHGVPCVTLREETEWVELVEAGWNFLVPPTSEAAISSGIRDALNRLRPPSKENYYGDGFAGEQIVREIRTFLGTSN